ncbi:phospholipase D-like domain-containing protein [Haladaptatus caseinilyticus]|uniref:phospholipase D-like domain-containing protein n=1 Tax=Haladaptatus caseinilyticus TaxID=2993314 RepID=UPI00224AF198|nr:phospholipase D-like domain-containing protein [Haladaptatus caseinilyticus]
MNEQLVDTCSDIVQEALYVNDEYYTDYSSEVPLDFKDSVIFYALNKVESKSVREYICQYDSDQFWNWDEITDEVHRVWYAFKLLDEFDIDGWQESKWVNEIIQWFKDQQTMRGEFNWVEGEDHTGPLSLFVVARPNSQRTLQAIEYFLNNPPTLYPAYNLPIGISAVCDYDYYTYRERISELADDLVNLQNDKGYFENSPGSTPKQGYTPKVSSFAISALSKVSGYEENIERAASWLINQYSESNRSAKRMSAYVLNGLLQTSKGPKVSQSMHQWESELAQQRLEKVSSSFLETSPPIKSGTHINTIRTEIERLIQKTEQVLKISSPYVDMLHEDIIDLSEENKNLSIKIISKPKGDVSGHRARLAKSAIEQLNRASNRHVRTNHLLHSRMILSDKNSLLLSSADLTRDQLMDEFNAGLLTQDKKAIEAADRYFDQIWAVSDDL